MARPDPPTAERIKSALVLLVLIVIVGYFALRAIPSAQRPILHKHTTVPASTSPGHGRP